jgi:hypothetical protein
MPVGFLDYPARRKFSWLHDYGSRLCAQILGITSILKFSGEAIEVAERLTVEKAKETMRSTTLKYLITWSLHLTRDELAKISERPDVLEKGLNYVRHTMKGSGLEIYRIVQMEEFTRFARPVPGEVAASAHPHGIAIAEASSVEEVRRMVDHWVEGFGFGGVSVRNYLEYEINPLVDITKGGRL